MIAWKSRTIRGKGVRPDDGAEAVVGRFDAAHPIAEGLVHRIAQGPRTAAHRPDFRAEELHAEDIGPLAADVFFAHVDDALQTEVGTGRGGGHAVLPGARLGDDPPLAHPQREQDLAERIVDLVRPGVVEVLAFQVDPGPAALFRQPAGEVQRRRPADIVLVQVVEFGLEGRIGCRPGVLDRQFIQGASQGFGNIASAERAKAAGRVGNARGGRHRNSLVGMVRRTSLSNPAGPRSRGDRTTAPAGIDGMNRKLRPINLPNPLPGGDSAGPNLPSWQIYNM